MAGRMACDPATAGARHNMEQRRSNFQYPSWPAGVESDRQAHADWVPGAGIRYWICRNLSLIITQLTDQPINEFN